MVKLFMLVSFDLNMCLMDDIKVFCDVDFKLCLFDGFVGFLGETRVGAFAGWFDVTFAGFKENLCENLVEFMIVLDVNGVMYWG